MKMPRVAAKVPAEVLARTGTPEKVLAWLRSGDSYLLGTRHRLLIVEADTVLNLPWEQIENARWNRDEDRLEILEVGAWGEPRKVHEFEVGAPGRLLELMRERVTASVVLQRRVAVHGKRGFIVIARRAPGGGPLQWFEQYDEGVDPDDPQVAEQCLTALRLARAEVGGM